MSTQQGRLPHVRTSGHVRLSRRGRSLRIGHILELRWVKTAIPMALGIAAVVLLIVGIDPHAFAGALRHFNYLLLPAILVASLTYYVLQGVRWHLLLRGVGIRLRWQDTVLLNVAGQATALLPLGELTRAVLVSEAARAEFGGVVATVTVQELIYTMVLIAFAVPGLLAVQHAFAGVIVALTLIAAIFVSLSWCPAYRWLRRAVAHTPLLRRVLHDVDELHNDTIILMREPQTLTWSVISAAQAAATIAVFWMVAEALAPGQLSVRDAAFVYAVSNLAGALSLIPGGIGAYEASVVGLLVGVGVPAGVAAAIAVVQRVVDKGLATALGFGAYAVARRRLNVTGLGRLAMRPQARQRAGAAAAGARG